MSQTPWYVYDRWQHFPFAPKGPPALGIENDWGICGNWASPVGTNTAKHTHNNIRALFGNFFAIVLCKMVELVDCMTNGLLVVLGGCLRVMEARGSLFIVFIKDIKTKTFFSFIDASATVL